MEKEFNKVRIDNIIQDFQKQCFQIVSDLTLHQLVSHTNLYLFKLKGILIANILIREIIEAHITNAEEKLFDNLLKGYSGNDQEVKEMILTTFEKAAKRDGEFLFKIGNLINKFTREFTIEYCKHSGEIDWTKLKELSLDYKL